VYAYIYVYVHMCIPHLLLPISGDEFGVCARGCVYALYAWHACV